MSRALPRRTHTSMKLPLTGSSGGVSAVIQASQRARSLGESVASRRDRVSLTHGPVVA